MRTLKLISLVGATLLAAGSPSSLAANPQSNPSPQTALIATLQSNATQKEKADACRELARVGGRDAVAPLAALLPDERLGHMARYALERIPDPAVDNAFRSALDRLTGRPLVGVIGSVGVRRDAKAVKPLARLLSNPDPETAQAAARALGSIGTPEAGRVLLAAWPPASPANRASFAEGLFRCAETLLAQGRRKDAIRLYDLLRKETESAAVRAAAWRGAMTARKTDDAVPLLREALRSNDRVVFNAGLRVLLETPAKAAADAALGEMPRLSAMDKAQVVQILAQLRDPRVMPALVALATNAEKPAVLAALRAFPEIGDPSPVPTLVSLVDHSDRELREAALESLAAMPGPEADQAILAMLNHPDPARKLTGLDLAARRRLTPAVNQINQLARHHDAQVRLAAVRRLGEMGGSAEIPPVLDWLCTARETAELEAAEQALAALCAKEPNPEAAAALVAARLAQATTPQKAVLLRVLSAVGGSAALNAIRAAVKDPAPEIRAAAVRALGSWRSPEVAPDLLELAQSAGDPTLKSLALRGYLTLAGDTEVPARDRLDMCQQAAKLVEKDDEKRLLLGVLSGMNSPAAVGLIEPFLDQPAIQEEACTAIVGLAEKLLQGKQAAKVAGRLVAPLEKVARVTSKADLARRATELVNRAKAAGA
ncbi:MAG TPA: HEAT repeat domain-containing protein [Candidatus Paceibacterota bacterium]|nr:HEAT repeat domain-containing protein [Candidatus Paceibacterota bacterium]